jgi:two-component system, NtrC family, nitrogen regulation sensor histidine kinase NtrY
MIFKSFNISLAVRLFFLVIFTAVSGIALYTRHWHLAAAFMFFLLLFTANLVYFLNGINRKISYFFDAAVNDDTSLHYPENIHTPSLKSLHLSFNRLNRHIAEMKMRNEHHERFYQELLKSSATGILAVDEKGYIEQVNDAALELLGMPFITHLDLLKQRKPEIFEQLMQINPGQSRVIRVMHGNELRLLSLKAARLNFGSSSYRLYSITNIKPELEENELDSWQKLIRVMTHEIMNSVAPITSLSNTLWRIFAPGGSPLPATEVTEKHVESILSGLEVIGNTGKGLMHFVEDYRQLTRIPAPVFKPVSVSGWMKGLKVLMEGKMAEENIQFEMATLSSHDEFIGDEKLLSQVIINLLNNAIDALKGSAGKKIILEISDNAQGRLRISVTDNGTGIPADEMEKIFIPFYTTKENGSGIGLSLARQIMRLHKGGISAFSVPRVKTAFVLDF